MIPIDLAVEPSGSEDEGYKSIWIRLADWLTQNPEQVFWVIIITISGYFFLKWISKYWFHELYFYKPKIMYRRYLGRYIRHDDIYRERAGLVRCTQPNCAQHMFYESEKQLENYKCENCQSTSYVMERKPDKKVQYANVKFMEQLFPPKIRILTIESKKITMYRKRFILKDNAQTLYQRIGLDGVNLFRNDNIGLYEVMDEGLPVEDHDPIIYKKALDDIVEDTDKFVYALMGANPNFVAPFVQDNSLPLPTPSLPIKEE